MEVAPPCAGWRHPDSNSVRPRGEGIVEGGDAVEQHVVALRHGDRYGVPHVHADSDADLFFGFGYATAQDRLFQLDYLRRKAREENDSAFLADIGAPAVRELLRRIDVDKVAEELRAALVGENSQHRKKQTLKRLKIR